MINGIAPVIIFTFLDKFRFGSYGLPAIVPIYLDENLTGVAADGANNRVAIETQTFKGNLYQRKAGQTLTLNMRISKNNVIGSTLLALMAKIYDIIGTDQSGEDGYFVTVYFDSSFMLHGYLSSFEQNTVGDTNQYEIKATFTSKGIKATTRSALTKVENEIDIRPRG